MGRHTRLVAVLILIALALMPWGSPLAGRRDDDRRGAQRQEHGQRGQQGQWEEKSDAWRQAKSEDSDDDEKGPWTNGVSPKGRKRVAGGERARVLVSPRLPGPGPAPARPLAPPAPAPPR